jgi:hypothetical protein
MRNLSTFLKIESQIVVHLCAGVFWWLPLACNAVIDDLACQHAGGYQLATDAYLSQLFERLWHFTCFASYVPLPRGTLSEKRCKWNLKVMSVRNVSCICVKLVWGSVSTLTGLNFERCVYLLPSTSCVFVD